MKVITWKLFILWIISWSVYPWTRSVSRRITAAAVATVIILQWFTGHWHLTTLKQWRPLTGTVWCLAFDVSITCDSLLLPFAAFHLHVYWSSRTRFWVDILQATSFVSVSLTLKNCCCRATEEFPAKNLLLIFLWPFGGPLRVREHGEPEQRYEKLIWFDRSIASSITGDSKRKLWKNTVLEL